MAHYFLHSVLLAEASLITKSYNQTHSQGIEIQSPHFVEEKTAKSCGKEHDDKEGGKTGTLMQPTTKTIAYYLKMCCSFQLN